MLVVVSVATAAAALPLAAGDGRPVLNVRCRVETARFLGELFRTMAQVLDIPLSVVQDVQDSSSVQVVRVDTRDSSEPANLEEKTLGRPEMETKTKASTKDKKRHRKAKKSIHPESVNKDNNPNGKMEVPLHLVPFAASSTASPSEITEAKTSMMSTDESKSSVTLWEASARVILRVVVFYLRFERDPNSLLSSIAYDLMSPTSPSTSSLASDTCKAAASLLQFASESRSDKKQDVMAVEHRLPELHYV